MATSLTRMAERAVVAAAIKWKNQPAMESLLGYNELRKRVEEMLATEDQSYFNDLYDSVELVELNRAMNRRSAKLSDKEAALSKLAESIDVKQLVRQVKVLEKKYAKLKSSRG